MAKKDKGKQREQQLIDQVSESANDIWLAGLAAFEKAQREGSKVFSKLVKEGEKVEARTLEVAGSQLDEIKAKASGTWDKLEDLFESRVQRALTSLGVPTGREIRHLAKKVDSLGESVETVGSKKSRAATKPKPKPAARKATRAAAGAKKATTAAAARTRTASAKKASTAAPAKTRTASAKKPAAATARRASAMKSAPAAQPKTSAKRVTRPRSAPKAAPKPAAQGADDLKAIGGIGPALERKLNSYGVTSYRQIAEWTSKDVEDVESKVIRISGRVARDNWITQAKSAQQKKYGS